MIKKTSLSIILFVTGFMIGYAQQRQDTLKRHSATSLGEISKDKELKINPDVLKLINLGSPRVSSSSSFMNPTSVKDLTNDILGKTPIRKDTVQGRIMLGMSCFSGFYQNPKHGKVLKVDPMGFAPLKMPPKGGMVIRASAPSYRASDRVSSMYGPSSNPLFSFGVEDLLESIFWRKPPDRWTHYGDLPTLSLETELPDSLVRIRQASVAMMDSLVRHSQKKYKIVYLFCDDADYSKANFPEVLKYINSRKDEFDLFPVSSGKDKNDLSCIAKYLKTIAYFSPVYVMSGRHKDSLILMLDQNNQAISLLACDTSMAKKLDDLKRLP